MLPDPTLPPIHLGPLTLYPFGILVAIGIMLGMWLATRRSEQLGLDPNITNDVGMWAVIPGFIGAHLVSVIFYTPEKLQTDPLILLKVWEGISSFGGFFGGAAGVVYYLYRKRVPFWHYADALAYGFAAAWIFGRLGCTVAFDHPGVLTDFVLGMHYPGGAASPGVRHNLGFYEALWAVGMFGFFYWQRNTPRVPGWYLVVFMIAYAPVRFAMDTLRVVDVRYLGLTPGQYAALLLFVWGLYLAWRRSQVDERVVPDGKAHVFADGSVAVGKSSSAGGAGQRPRASHSRTHGAKRKRKK